MKLERTGRSVGLSVCGVCVKDCECAGSTFSSKWGYHNHSLKLSHQLEDIRDKEVDYCDCDLCYSQFSKNCKAVAQIPLPRRGWPRDLHSKPLVCQTLLATVSPSTYTGMCGQGYTRDYWNTSSMVLLSGLNFCRQTAVIVSDILS